MRTLADVLKGTTGLEPVDAEWLHLLVEDWQLLADLAFSDLVLWVRHEDGWVAAAHTRPMTGPMVYVDDLVGRSAGEPLTALLDRAYDAGGELVAEETASTERLERVQVIAVGVRRWARTLGVLTRHTNLDRSRPNSPLESTYRILADRLTVMVGEGAWPIPGSPTGLRRGAPRVGDGVVHLDDRGEILYASPNATSAIRRLGHSGAIEGEVLATIVGSLPRHDGPVDEALAVVTMGRAAWRADVAADGAAVSLRAIPLLVGGRRAGAIVLLRDVSELRRREHELMSKDQTIREIHHRVKNNLQTVAALLRLQARRIDDEAGRVALSEAVRRVGSIAMVYEALSTGFTDTVDFDDIAVRGLRAVVELASTTGHISSAVSGSFGQMRPEDATAVALVVSELVQNSVEHGLAEGGRVTVEGERSVEDGQDILRVQITDDGVGIPAGFRPGRAGLGTRIVTSMVQDLRGTIRWEDLKPHGTRVRFSAQLRPVD